MKRPHVPHASVLLLALLVPLALGLSLQEDDLVFDDVGDENSASVVSSTVSSIITLAVEAHQLRRDPPHQRYIDDEKSPSAERHHRRIERLWGVPDIAVPVGHVFKLKIPKQAFSGNVDRYEIHEASGGRAPPRWMYWDEPASTLLGVPSSKDAGNYHLSVKAFGKGGDTAKDAFLVQVVPEKREELKHKDGKSHCADGEEQTLMAIILDAKFDSLAPLVRVDAIENLAGFLGMHTSAFSLHPQNGKESTAADTSIILMGPGNVKHRKERHTSSIQWQVGCDGHLWRHQSDLVKQLRLQAKDGTLAEVLQLPVLQWCVKTDSSSFLRNRRDAGSGDFENADDYEPAYEDYGEDYEDGEEDEDGNESVTEIPNLPSFGTMTNSARGNEPEHPHRHHHGEETIDWNTEDVIDTLEILRNQNLLNRTSSSYAFPITTTTQLTSSPSTSTSTILPTTSSTTSTTTQAAPTSISTTTPPTTTTTTTTTATSITTTTTTTTSTTSTTATSTTADTTTDSRNSSASTPPSTESSRSESTEEIMARTRHVESESVNVAIPTSYPELTTSVSFSATVPLHSSTAAISTSLTDKSEVETPIVFVNVTTEEQTTEEGTVSSTRQLSTTLPSAATIGYNSTAFWTTIIPKTPTTMRPPTTTEVHTSSPNTVPIFVNTTMAGSSTSTTASIPSTSGSPTTTTSPAATTTTTTTTTTSATRTTMRTTTMGEPTSSPTSPASRITTENVEYGVHNFSPRKDKRLKKIAVTAGKPLSYIIPADTFNDLEDGNTRKLKLSLFLQGIPLKNTHWLQFNTQTQEVYGLPLENDISIWDYELVASDSEGLNVSDRLDIHVQQHKLSRTVNHEFSIYLKIDKRNEFPTDVDWELKVIRSLAELYGDADPHHITVRSIDINHDQSIFTWTNDSLPRSSECPKGHINRLLNVLIDKDADPSPGLRRVLAPEIRVKRVVYQGIGQCEEMNQPELPGVPAKEPKVNFPPVPRNQVDHVNATVGQLLVFKVPEDTFFDAEDGSARNMKMSLLTIDRTPIPPHEWLQFDSKNEEFYGVPLRNDIGRKEYQLVVTDREGASATDGLVVVVHPAVPMQHTVEFSMTLDIPYESFAHSALQKRNFIEKLRDLYRDRDTSAISLHSISNGSTVITWHNRTLPTSYCANDEVNRLRAVLVKSDNDRRSVTDEVLDVMGQKFPVKQITVIPMGICLGELTGVHSPDSYVPSIDDSTSVGTFNDDYLITFVLPAIIIAAMLILAGIIACVLYRRRRSGKMSVSEQDDERQSFRSKGIPVIFQDELDEKPDPGNKSPVILKEEKPPLPPPEYQKTDDGADIPMLPKENSEEPYQPPPPFATNRDTNRQNRPKPTPTYRKPPPYVPP